jgi:hypothetical protein
VLERGPQSTRQRLYLSEQTDGSEPNRLVLVEVEVQHPRTASADHLQDFSENTKSPHVSRALKTLVHPGEVNRIREVPQHPHVLITHTDAPELHVWNTDSQPDRAGVKVRCWPRGWVPGRCAAERAALLWSAGGCRAPCRHSSRHPTASTLSPTRRAPLPSSSQSQTLC